NNLINFDDRFFRVIIIGTIPILKIRTISWIKPLNIIP
ncbi:unnamed protein product, partial [marine sediment metagenome]